MSVRPRSLAHALSYAIFAIGVGFVAACIVPRFRSAWPLEWMEGASLEHAQRLLRGDAIYAPPSAEFIAFIYPPLAYVPMALSARLFGASLASARAVSLAALVVSLWALVRAGSRWGAEPAAGLLAAGLFALGYGYTGGFLDVARVDGVFIALCLVGCERLSAGRERAGLAWLALACFAKQHAALLLMAAALQLLATQGRRRARDVALSFGLVGVLALALEIHSDGWFSRYVGAVPSGHRIVTPLLLSFLAIDLGVYLPVLCGLCVAGALRRRPGQHMGDALLLAAIVASALGRAHPGGDDNVRLPAYALLSLMAAVSFWQLVARAQSRRARAFLCTALAVQAAVLLQSPSLYAPTPSQARALQQLRRQLVRCAGGGSAVALDHTGLTATPFVHTMAWSDFATSRPRYAALAERAVLDALRGARAPAAIAVSAAPPALERVLSARYALCARTPAIVMPTGYRVGPTRVFRRK